MSAYISKAGVEFGSPGLSRVSISYKADSEINEFVYIHKDDFIRGHLHNSLKQEFVDFLCKHIPVGLSLRDHPDVLYPVLHKVSKEIFKMRVRENHSPRNIIIAHMIIMLCKMMFFSAVRKSEIRILDYILSQIIFGFEYNDYCADARKYSYILRCNEYQEVRNLPDLRLANCAYYFKYNINEVHDADIFPPQHNLPFAPSQEELRDIEYAMVEDEPIAEEDLSLLRIFLRKTLQRYRTSLEMPDDLDRILASKDSKTIDRNTGRSVFDKNLMHEVPRWHPVEILSGFEYTRTYIYKSPHETRDGVNTTKSNKMFLHDMNYLLMQITKAIPYCGIGKVIPKFRNDTYIIMMDIEKDGHTQNREVLQVFCEELESAYPAFPFTYFSKGTNKSIVKDFNGQLLKTKRGWGIGMMNCLAGFITGTIIQMTNYKSFVTNDDIVIDTDRIDLVGARTAYSEILAYMKKYRRLVKLKKTVISKSVKTCEQYQKVHHYDYEVDKELARDLSLIQNIVFAPVAFMAKDNLNNSWKTYGYRSHINWDRLKYSIINNYSEHPYELLVPGVAGGFDLEPNNLDWTVRRYYQLTQRQKYWFQNHCDPPGTSEIKWSNKEGHFDYYAHAELKEEYASNWIAKEILGNYSIEKILSSKMENFCKNKSRRPERLLPKLKKIQQNRMLYFKRKDKHLIADEIFITEYVHNRPRPYALPYSWIRVQEEDEYPYQKNRWMTEGVPGVVDKLRAYQNAFNIKTNLQLRKSVDGLDYLEMSDIGQFTLWQDDRDLGPHPSIQDKTNNTFAGFQFSAWLNPYRNIMLAEVTSRIKPGRRYIYDGPCHYKDTLRNLVFLSACVHLRRIKRFVPHSKRVDNIVKLHLPPLLKDACAYYVHLYPDEYNQVMDALSKLKAPEIKNEILEEKFEYTEADKMELYRSYNPYKSAFNDVLYQLRFSPWVLQKVNELEREVKEDTPEDNDDPDYANQDYIDSDYAYGDSDAELLLEQEAFEQAADDEWS